MFLIQYIFLDAGTYDFIIIGAGAGGSAIANELSQNRRWKILLLEAGEFEDDFVDIPGMFSYLHATKYNWNYKSIPQTTSCLGMVDKKCVIPRGKGFGGTTLINGLIYSRGNKLDFDKWEAEGNPGWSYRDVLPYFIKTENTSVPDVDKGYHGYSGNLHVEYHCPTTEMYRKFTKANEELGTYHLDYNGRDQLGISKVQSLTLHGKRFSSARAFLFPILKRENLKLSGKSFVTKIVVGEAKKAERVYYTRNGTTFYASVRKEVILSAGSIGTPQILMLSGIGPKNHLNELNIPLKEDLPVGETYYDHVSYNAINVLTNFSVPQGTLDDNVKMFLDGCGPLTLCGGVEAVSFYNLRDRESGCKNKQKRDKGKKSLTKRAVESGNDADGESEEDVEAESEEDIDEEGEEYLQRIHEEDVDGHLENFIREIKSERKRDLKHNIGDYYKKWNRKLNSQDNYEPGTEKESYAPLRLFFSNIKRRLNQNNSSVPDIEFIFFPSNSVDQSKQDSFQFTNETYAAYTQNIRNHPSFSLTIVCLHPKSFGTLRLKSKNPFEYPLIDTKFLSDTRDLEILYKAILYIKELVETSALRKIDAKLDLFVLPACAGFVVDTREFWYCQLRQMALNIYHPMSTAKMLPRSKGGVVDYRLKVYGIQNLRICDASAFPTTISGHPVAVVTMMAAKLGYMIKKEYRFKN